ncbi:MAG: hypothetical protein MUO35_03810 [Anaerolineales bacterium]|nr:hypothetical protein [Anaerolineales bacterium]
MSEDSVIRQAFDDFRRDLFEPMCERNDKAHEAVFGRLDRLNGWRNKLLGMAILAAFVSPLAIALILR